MRKIARGQRLIFVLMQMKETVNRICNFMVGVSNDYRHMTNNFCNYVRVHGGYDGFDFESMTFSQVVDNDVVVVSCDVTFELGMFAIRLYAMNGMVARSQIFVAHVMPFTPFACMTKVLVNEIIDYLFTVGIVFGKGDESRLLGI